MQLGMIGLGRMGANMVRRLMRADILASHTTNPRRRLKLSSWKVRNANSLESVIGQLATPRAVWLMVPAAAVDRTLDELLATGRFESGDGLIDGGNSYLRRRHPPRPTSGTRSSSTWMLAQVVAFTGWNAATAS